MTKYTDQEKYDKLEQYALQFVAPDEGPYMELIDNYGRTKEARRQRVDTLLAIIDNAQYELSHELKNEYRKRKYNVLFD